MNWRWLIIGLLIGFFLRGLMSGKHDEDEYVDEEVTQPQRSSKTGPLIVGVAIGMALMVLLLPLRLDVTVVEDTPLSESTDLLGRLRVGCEPEDACEKMRPRQEKPNEVILKIPEAVTLDLHSTRLPPYARLQVCVNEEACQDVDESIVLRDLKGTVTIRVIIQERQPTV